LSLVELALRLGERAKRWRKTVTLNPLSPRDRRIVHLALRDDRLLTTRSVGEGFHRRLLIVPEGAQKREEPPPPPAPAAAGDQREERPRRSERGGRRRRAKG
jgi:spoIIIJ-associated protein